MRALPRFGIERFSRGDQRIWAARTGYTGEDGLELFPPADGAVALWRELTELASGVGVRLQPAGLAARDTLRLEAGFALYGHELTEDLTPVEARLLWACDLDHDFIGRDAVLARKSTGAARTLRRLVMIERGVPRAGYPVVDAAGATVRHGGFRRRSAVRGRLYRQRIRRSFNRRGRNPIGRDSRQALPGATTPRSGSTGPATSARARQVAGWNAVLSFAHDTSVRGARKRGQWHR